MITTDLGEKGIEVGKEYLTRDGRKVFVFAQSLARWPFGFTAQVEKPVERGSPLETYTDQGSWNGVTKNDLDIRKEILEI